MRISSTLLTSAVVALGALIVMSPLFARAQGFPSAPPPDLAIRPYVPPNIVRRTLPNGLRMVIAEQHNSPLVTMRLSLPAGSVSDPSNQPGLASSVAAQFTAGTDKYTSVQLHEAVEDLGGTLGVGAGSDFTTLSTSVLSENFNPMTDLMADVILHPTFPDSELKVYKGLQLQGLVVQRQNPGFLAQEQISRALYGSHPYGVVSTTAQAINALTTEKLSTFYRERYIPQGSVLVIVGDVNPARAFARIEKTLGGWKSAGPAASASAQYPPPPTRDAREVILVNRPGSVQSNIVFGNLAIKRNDPDYYALSVANVILGGGSSSRLFNNVREKQGYAYDVSSSPAPRALAGDYTLSAQTRTDVTAAALKEMLAEAERIRATPVTDAELKSAKSYLSGVFVISLTSQNGVADRLLATEQYGLPQDYLTTYRDRIAAITPADVLRVESKYLQPDKFAIIIVGDADKLRDSLRPFGPLTEPK